MNKLRKFGIMAGVLIFTGILVMQTDYAQDRAGKMAKGLNIESLIADENKNEEEISAKNMPKDLKIKIFDKDGNVIEEINEENIDRLYNSDGNHVTVYDDRTILTDQMIEERIEQNRVEDLNYMTAVSDLDELQKHLDFKVKFPEYIPEGFEFIRAQCMDYEKTESGIITSYSLELQNRLASKFMSIQVMHLVKNQKAEGVLDNINNAKEGMVNGNSAMAAENSLTWIDGDILFEVFGDSLDEQERMKVAESIK